MVDNKKPASPAAEEEKMIPVSEGTLKAILEQNKEILEKVKGLESENEILRESVNQGRLTEAEDKRKPQQNPRSYLKVFMGQPVIGWKSSKENKLVYRGTEAIGEVLQATYSFLNGTDSGVVDQVSFTRTEDKVWVRWVEDLGAEVKIRFESLETPDEDLKKNFKLPTEEVVIHKNFLNP